MSMKANSSSRTLIFEVYSLHVHEFADEGFVEMRALSAASTAQTSRTQFGATCASTAIKLGEFQNGPLLQ